jgi:hypothetical protein
VIRHRADRAVDALTTGAARESESSFDAGGTGWEVVDRVISPEVVDHAELVGVRRETPCLRVSGDRAFHRSGVSGLADSGVVAHAEVAGGSEAVRAGVAGPRPERASVRLDCDGEVVALGYC